MVSNDAELLTEHPTRTGLPEPPPTAQLGIDTVDPIILGGKGASLAELIAADYPVPGTGVVTTGAYRSIADHDSVRALVERISSGDAGDRRSPNPDSDSAGGGTEAEAVDAVFASVPVDDQLAAAIADLARSVGRGGPVAVRSSATVEDLHGSSFAGQYRSLLNVDSSDPEDVLDAVRAVWASLWHPAPAAYRRAFDIDEDGVAMAVVIMRMIPATTAGVVFTADPGGSDGARVEAVDGLGEALVSGQATPSAWVVARDDRGRADDDPRLTPAAARALELAIDIEDHLGCPQDIEWAAVGSEVSVVQARPITVLEDHDGFDTAVDDHELTTAGIVEMVPGVLPPLRWEINRFLLEEAFRAVLDSLGVIRGRAAEDRPFVRRVRGRAVIDFDQLREVADDIPGAVAELERQYFGHSDRPSGDPDAGTVRPRRSGRLAALARDLRTLRTRRQVIEQADITIRATQALSARWPALESWTDEQLLSYGRRLVDLGARGLAAELGVAAAGAAAFQRLQLQLSSHLGEAEGPAAAQMVTAHSGIAISRSAEASAAVFAGPTWTELDTRPPVGVESSEDLATTAWFDLRDRLRALPGWTRRRILTGGFVDVRLRLIHHLVADVSEQLRRREAAKAAILQLGGEVRRTNRELGRRLVDRALIEDAADIELLTPDEIRGGLLADDNTTTPTPDVLRRRRNWLSRYENEGSLPVRFAGPPDREAEPLPEGDALDGWAASPGRRRGRARVVHSATGRIERGEILVAEATDASWSPLFLRAGAIVVERGGPLSHAAILARELGLPAVLNVPGASRVLDGCTVTVDGDRGVVVIEQRRGEEEEGQP